MTVATYFFKRQFPKGTGKDAVPDYLIEYSAEMLSVDKLLYSGVEFSQINGVIYIDLRNVDVEKLGDASKIYVSPQQFASLVVGITPADAVKDFFDFAAGQDVFTGEQSNRLLLGLTIVTPELVDQALKHGAKNTDDILSFITKKSDELTNVASDFRTNHILYGDKTGGGHLWPGNPGKSVFPETWNADAVMHNISDIATDPNSIWQKGRVIKGVQRYEVIGVRDGVIVKVITDGKDIITAFPIK